MSKPRSRRSVLVYAVMSSSHSSNHKVADKWRLDCCRGATTDEKCFSFRLRLRDILAAFQPFKGLTRYSRRPSAEDILKCCICASVRPVVGNVHDRMPAFCEMDFFGARARRFDEDGAGGDRGEAGGVGYGSFARFFNSANARPARRPSLVAVELSSLAWSALGPPHYAVRGDRCAFLDTRGSSNDGHWLRSGFTEATVPATGLRAVGLTFSPLACPPSIVIERLPSDIVCEKSRMCGFIRPRALAAPMVYD